MKYLIVYIVFITFVCTKLKNIRKKAKVQEKTGRKHLKTINLTYTICQDKGVFIMKLTKIQKKVKTIQ